MKQLPERVEVADLPPYVEMWSVAKIPNFIPAVLGRWQRDRGELPPQFYVLVCPQVEVNAAGGLPARVVELTDPRLRCRHFTGCHKPYFVVFFVGEDADRKRAEVQAMLSWSESYRVDIGTDAVRLAFVDAMEDLGDEDRDATPAPRTLRDLLATGEIVSILE
jgi:hypothetical protein